MIVKQLITTNVVPVKPTDTGEFALLQMEEARLSHLPVVEGSDFIGVISDKNILLVDEPSLEIGQYRISPTRVFIEEEQHVYEALKLFSTLNLTMLPVVNSKSQYIGEILLQTIVHALSDMAGIHNPGGIIVLEINDKDYNLGEIVQVVESNDAMILSCFVTSRPDSTMLEVTIKVNRIEIGPLLQAFFRLNILVTASWSKEDLYSEGLQDRFDALMNYLNI